MDKPDRVGEPSMDEILASIRKIIADEPGSERKGVDALGVNPLIEPAEPDAGTKQKVAGADEPLLPAVDRLTEALQSMPTDPAATNGFDDDLKDLLEDSPGGHAVSSEGTANGAGKKVSSISASGLEDANAGLTPGPDAPVAGSESGEAETKSQAGRFSDGGAASSRSEPAKPSKVVPNFATAFPQVHDAALADPGETAADAGSSEPPLSAMIPITPQEAAHQESALAAPSGPDAGTAPAVRRAGPPEPFPFDVPAGATELPASSAVATSVVAGATDTETAASSALGALAAGLAASSVVDQASSSALGGLSGGDQTLAPGTLQAKQRTLEDVVADMLRPMIEKWVAENMPRIMEKALRGEVAVMKGSNSTSGFRR